MSYQRTYLASVCLIAVEVFRSTLGIEANGHSHLASDALLHPAPQSYATNVSTHNSEQPPKELNSAQSTDSKINSCVDRRWNAWL